MPPHIITIDELERALAGRLRTGDLIAIDGLPCSGKSTLAERLATKWNALQLPLDDFLLPVSMRAEDIAPAFPFPFFRIEEFRQTLSRLAAHSTASYLPYDWKTGTLASKPVELSPDRVYLVEGCSVLDPSLLSFYRARIFLESDRATMMATQRARDGALDERNWANLYVPSVDLYMATEPAKRADFVVAGRGALAPSSSGNQA